MINIWHPYTIHYIDNQRLLCAWQVSDVVSDQGEWTIEKRILPTKVGSLIKYPRLVDLKNTTKRPYASKLTPSFRVIPAKWGRFSLANLVVFGKQTWKTWNSPFLIGNLIGYIYIYICLLSDGHVFSGPKTLQRKFCLPWIEVDARNRISQTGCLSRWEGSPPMKDLERCFFCLEKYGHSPTFCQFSVSLN